MKILINFVAFIAFIAQSIFFVFSALNQKKPEAMMESLYNYFVFLALLCSLITIIAFYLQKNRYLYPFKNSANCATALALWLIPFFISLPNSAKVWV